MVPTAKMALLHIFEPKYDPHCGLCDSIDQLPIVRYHQTTVCRFAHLEQEIHNSGEFQGLVLAVDEVKVRGWTVYPERTPSGS